MPSRASTAKRLAVGACVLGFIGAVLASQADAHFVLQSPPTWMTQDSLGLPEKLGPCGDEYDGTDAAVPTGTVTAVREGQKIKVTINEVIFHPGHYRIALAKKRSDLPAEPVVTEAGTPCGSAAIQDPPVFPVLADGVFVHTTAFTAPQTIEVQLPAGFTCPDCTLQVIEFMAQHGLNVPGGCFYHHCADLAIQASTAADSQAPSDGAAETSSGSGGSKGSGPRDDAAVASSDDGGEAGSGSSGGFHGPASSSGCSAAPGARGAAWPMLLGALVLLVGRRRRAS